MSGGRRGRGRWLVLACAVVVGGVAAACSKDGGGGDSKVPPPIDTAERARGVDVCQKWAARVCACAEKDPSFKDACALAKGQPEALQIDLDLLSGTNGKLNDKEARMTQAAARKVIAACVHDDGALPADKCPRDGS